MREIILYLILLIFTSCCPYKATKYDKQHWDKEIKEEYEFPPRNLPKIEVINIPEIDAEIVIFPKNYTMYRDFNNSYTPNIAEIKYAENHIKIHDSSNNTYQKYSNFNKRQYIGNYSKEGEKILFINFLKIKSACQKKSINAYLFDKYFLDMLHRNDDEEIFRLILPKKFNNKSDLEHRKK